MAEPEAQMSEEDKMAAEWAAALAETKPGGNEVASEVAGPTETVAPAQFAAFQPGAAIFGAVEITFMPYIRAIFPYIAAQVI